MERIQIGDTHQSSDQKTAPLFMMWISLFLGPVLYTLIPILAWKGVISFEETVVFSDQSMIDLLFTIGAVASLAIVALILWGGPLLRIMTPGSEQSQRTTLFFIKIGLAEIIGILGLIYGLLTGDAPRALVFGIATILLHAPLYPGR